jgi:hypothetical protein
MSTQDQGGGLRRMKGWIGYVWNYPDWQEKVVLGGLWDNMDWTNGEKPKEEIKDKMGKIIQKW